MGLGVQCNILITKDDRPEDETLIDKIPTTATFDPEPETDGDITEGETTEDEKHDTEDDDFHSEEDMESELDDDVRNR